MSTTKKTYFATPNSQYTPNGLIKLGQIISNHKAPGRRICEPFQPLPKVFPSYLDDWEHEKSQTLGGSIGVFAQWVALFLGLGGDLSTNFAKERATLLKFQKLETCIIEPPDDYIDQSMRAEAVQKYLRANRRTDSLFMITGIKVARGARCTKHYDSDLGLEGSVNVDLTSVTGTPLSLGPKSSIYSHTINRETFSGSSDFVFAYRLNRISIQRK